MKKLFLFFATLLLTCNVFAQTTVANGTTGPLTWILTSDGVLNISGAGAMPADESQLLPLFPYVGNITSVVIGNGVTSIIYSVFDYCNNLVAITVDANNLQYSSADGVLFNKAKTELLFCPASKTSVTIPGSVTTIGNSAFSSCYNLREVTVAWTNPINISSSAFRNIYRIALHVPEGSEQAYREAPVWKDF
jgi:hypothetical protein